MLTNGSMRRVVIARPGPDGKVVAKEYNLDEYVKDGNLKANPEVMPDDVVMFGYPKGIAIDQLYNILSPLLILNSVFRIR